MPLNSVFLNLIFLGNELKLKGENYFEQTTLKSYNQHRNNCDFSKFKLMKAKLKKIYL